MMGIHKNNHGTGGNPAMAINKTETIATNSQTNKIKKSYVQKRIKCEECDKKFNRNDTFKKHMESTHKQIGTQTNENNQYQNQNNQHMDMTFPNNFRRLRNHKDKKQSSNE